VRLLELQDYFMIPFGVLNKEKALPAASGVCRALIFYSSYESKLPSCHKKLNPGDFAPGLFLCRQEV
jgi:hypothetical protein